jgi:flotillin
MESDCFKKRKKEAEAEKRTITLEKIQAAKAIEESYAAEYEDTRCIRDK